MDKVRLAVIGCGGISAAHINGILAEPRAELAYCVDINAALAREKAEKAGCQHATDYLSILGDVDAVDICTPPHLHAEMTIAAARAGKHVLCEKIMAISLEQAEAMIAATDRAGVLFMVAFVLRYRREFMMLNEICRSGQLGQIHQAVAQTSMQLGLPPQEWRRSVATHPFGCFMSHGCHYVDQLTWHLGEIIETASTGNAMTFADWIPGGDDTTCAIFKHNSGAVSAYVESWATPYPMTPLKIDVYGKQGSARVEYLHDGRRVVDLLNTDGWQRVWEFDPSNQEMLDVFGGAKDMHGQISHFVECVIENKQPLTHGREAIKPMQVIAASMAAEHEGKIVNVADFLAARK
jgi:predicted dehydrogenase